MATETKKRGRPKKDQQTYLEGTAPVSIPEIDRAAAKYVDVRNQRMELTEDEVPLKVKLLDAMKNHSLTEYRYDGFRVVVEPGEDNVKVKKLRAPKTEE